MALSGFPNTEAGPSEPARKSLIIGILETGRSRDALIAHFGSYVDMFRTLFEAVAPELSFRVYAVLNNDLPKSVTECDGWLITGSRHGVYDDLPWMRRLKEFLCQAVDAERPVVGICFGHQILAEALGGVVRKSDRGWGIAVHRYTVTEQRPWMQGSGENADPADAPILLNAMHQDQVEQVPAVGAKVSGVVPHVFAASDFCPYAGLRYSRPTGDGAGERDLALSFQAHPEFAPDYEAALIRSLAGTSFAEEQADKALASLESGIPAPQQVRIANWIAAFFQHAVKTD